jgi:Cu/Ag efflux pump CusA
MMRSLVTWSTKYRVVVVAIAAALVVIGARQLRDMPVDVLPEFSPPRVEIQTEALGLSAQEVEQLVTLGLEQDLLNGVPWLESLRSESVPGLSSIVLTFKPGTDLMRARQMVSERLTQAFALPHVSRPPTMLQPMSSTSRVMLVGLSSKTLSPIQMSVLARWTIAPRLLGVPGVANVAIWGQRDRQLQVLVDPQRLRDRKVSLLQVLETTGNALWVSSLSFVEASTPGTGGFIDNANQRLGIRHILPIVSPEGLAQIPIEATGVRLGDVADVVEGHQPLIGDALTNGSANLLLVVDRFPGANLRNVTRGVEDALVELRPGMTGLEVNTSIFRPAGFIETALGTLGWVTLVGFGLVVLAVTMWFYDWRPALITVAAITVSLVAGAWVLYLQGATLNVMVLAGFLMAIGVVVDDAIVHVDAIGRRLREARRAGSSQSAAATILDAVAGLRSATLFATLILLLAVMPLFFLAGLPSTFSWPLAVAYGLAVLASMVVALTVTPALSLVLLARPIERREAPMLRRLQQWYDGALARTLERPRHALVSIGLVLAIGLAMLPLLERSRGVLPKFAERDLLIHLNSAPGTSQPEMSRISARVSVELRSLPGVRDVGAHVGRAIFGDQVVNVNSAELWVSIDSTADYDGTVAAVRALVSGYPGLRPRVETYLSERTEPLMERSQDSIVVRVYGDADAVLHNAAGAVGKAVAEVAGVTAARVDRPSQEPVLEVEVDLAAALRHGIKPGDVRRAAATMFSGLQVGNLFEEQKVFDVVVWGTAASRHSLNSVRELMIDKPGGGHVRLGDVAHVRIVSSLRAIRHEAVKRYLDVIVGVRGRDLAAVAGDIRQRLQSVPMPLEHHAEVLGAYAERQASRQRALVLAVAAVVGWLLLLQAALGSWRLAGLGLATVSASLVGGLVAAVVAGGSISIGSLVGFLIVFGIAIRNSLQSLASYHTLVPQAREPFGPGVVVRGARERAAPIFMTASVIALGLLPAVLWGNRPGLEVVHAAAVVVLGGLVTATLIDLFILPALYLALQVVGTQDEELSLPAGLAEVPVLGVTKP